MAKKILIDCDPGIDDAVALCLALFDPRIEVVGITATAGNVDGHQATSNVITILDQLDPPKWPRIGAATINDRVPDADGRHLHGEDGLADTGLPATELANQRPAEKVISDAVHESPGEVSIVALGPLTNIALALQREKELASQIDQIVMVGGSVDGVGNITAAAEFNMFCDPVAARFVFSSPTTKTLIPLDVTRKVTMTYNLVGELPEPSTRAGALMHKIVPFLFRSCRRAFGQEGIHLHDALGVLFMVHPELFATEEMSGDVETSGEITRGATIFDRRNRAQHRTNMEVATNVDAAAISDCIVRGLRYAGQNT